MNHYPWELVALLFLGFTLYALHVLFSFKRKQVRMQDTENMPFVSRVQTTKRKSYKLNAQGRWLRAHC